MRLSTLIVAIFLAATTVSSACAQWGQTSAKVGVRGNRLNRFNAAPAIGFGGQNGATLFDLYRTNRIPTPPYFSLHPPVYYNGIDYQRYGSTPFAYPYTWWQQYGYGYNGGPPPVSGHGPTAAPYGPMTIENPHSSDEATTKAPLKSQAQVILNPFVKSNGEVAAFDASVALIVNPHVKPDESSRVSVAQVD